MNDSFSNEPYHSTKTLSVIVTVLFATLIACYALMFILGFAQTVLPIPVLDLDDGDTMPWTYLFIGLTAILEILVRVSTIVFFLIWLHRSFKNLPALRSNNLEFSPGWAVGWWFIPFANLVKPYQVMRELWNTSDADFDPDLFLSNNSSAVPIISWWWGLFIVGGFVGRISDKMPETASSASIIVMMIYCALYGASAFLILTIVRKITQQQELRFQKLSAAGQFAPPAPPAFDEKN